MPNKIQKTAQTKASGAAAKIRKDAEGQFAPKRHGGKNDGLDSAAPVVTTGDGDATFDNNPDSGDPGGDDG